MDAIKKYYVLNIKGFEQNKMCACTIAFEGTQLEVSSQEKNVYKVAKKYGGMEAGSENGIRGYFLTFMIAYLRDFAAQYNFVAESFETSCPWSKVNTLCTNVREKLMSACKARGIKEDRVFASFRVT
jgi:alkyldihydroxyacetonephosphate synthase